MRAVAAKISIDQCMPYLGNVEEGGKVTMDLHPESDQHPNVTSSWRLTLGRACLSSLVDIHLRVRSYLADRHTNTHTRTRVITIYVVELFDV